MLTGLRRDRGFKNKRVNLELTAYLKVPPSPLTIQLTKNYFKNTFFPSCMKLILLGPPGSGKGTVAEQLGNDYSLLHIYYSLLHISAGEILREEVQKETTLGKEIKKYIETGKLVPDQFVVEIVKLEVKGKDNYILDGFPRTVKQAEAIGDLDIDIVVYENVVGIVNRTIKEIRKEVKSNA